MPAVDLHGAAEPSGQVSNSFQPSTQWLLALQIEADSQS